MKLNRVLQDGELHTYCLRCRQETVRSYRQSGRLMYRCNSCDHVASRALVLDPAINWWLGSDGEYWHEAAGVFLQNDHGEFLFFERTSSPFGLAVPAGHVDHGEAHLATARRELSEETSVRLAKRAFRHVVTDDVRGDSCRRGSDAHRWHAYAAKLPARTNIKVSSDEGTRPVWLSLSQALQRDLTFVTRYAITHYARQIIAAAQSL
jgi:8-oxo-dGTP pyrophosphatase MutT (NUDIX family)